MHWTGKIPGQSRTIKDKIVRASFIFGLFILPVKFRQNRQNKWWHSYSTGKIARRLSK